MYKHNFPPEIQTKCLKFLYETCGNRACLPTALVVSVSDRQGPPQCSGWYGEVWKVKYESQDVTLKVIKLHSINEHPKVIPFHFCALR